jgi:hypothetical protein
VRTPGDRRRLRRGRAGVARPPGPGPLACALVAAQLPGLIDELPDDPTVWSPDPLLRHLAACPRCQGELASYRRLLRLLRSLRVVRPAFPAAPGWPRPLGGEEARVLTELRRRAARTRRRLVAAGTSLGVVLAGGLLVVRSWGRRVGGPGGQSRRRPDLLT